MLVKHELLSTPDSSKKIWRYVDLTKYLDLLITGELHFSNPAVFEDPYDTSTSAYLGQDKFSFILTSISEIFSKWDVYVNCWHLNEEESAALWKLYMKSDEGIAIQSTVGHLMYCLNKTDKKLYLGEVKYRDKKDIIESIQSHVSDKETKIQLVTHKRKSFQHEQELRIFLFGSENPELKNPYSNNARIKININELIENIYVNSKAPSWIVETIRSVSKKYGLKAKIIHSELYKKRDIFTENIGVQKNG